MKNEQCPVQGAITTALAQLPFVPKHLYIGYSGGVDSHVLLHASAQDVQIQSNVIAVYIHHGLQKQADAWATHCQDIANQLGVGFLTRQVNATPLLGQSPEEAARDARYGAFKTLLHEEDVLLLAHHQEDQLETVLLQLFRGTGLPGLAGMPSMIKNDTGWLLRPLLNVPKQSVIDYAAHHRLVWVEDPSNQDSVYDRNFLRQTIMPSLKARWPSLDKTVARTAQHCAQAQAFIHAYAKENLYLIQNATDQSLDILRLQTYPPIEQRWLLREWFASLKMKMPPQHTLERLCHELIETHKNTTPQLQLKNMTLRRYQNKLMALPKTAHQPFLPCAWPCGQDTLTLSNRTQITRKRAQSGLSKTAWDSAHVTVKLRQGGEKIHLPHRAGRRDLKKLFQDATIPAWQREKIPLIYFDDKLAAVGDLWLAAEFYTDSELAYVISLDYH